MNFMGYGIIVVNVLVILVDGNLTSIREVGRWDMAKTTEIQKDSWYQRKAGLLITVLITNREF